MQLKSEAKINYVCRKMRGEIKICTGEEGAFAHMFLEISTHIWHECQVTETMSVNTTSWLKDSIKSKWHKGTGHVDNSICQKQRSEVKRACMLIVKMRQKTYLGP